MKKSKIFMAAGAVVLAISAVFATKANKKFTTVTSAQSSGSSFIKVTGQSNLLTTVSGTPPIWAELVTAASKTPVPNTLFQMFTDVHETHALYYK